MKKQCYPFLYLGLFLLLCSPLSAQWTLSDLSQARGQMGAASLGAKAYFAGGSMASGQTNRVDIYNSVNGSWSTKSLSIARAFPAVAGNGSKVLFAGGIFWDNLTHYTRVDIYDTLAQTFTTANLSVPRMYAQAASVGNEVLFAGGYKISDIAPLTFTLTDVIDVYNTGTGNWSTKTLSQARGAMAVAVSGNIAVFAGGQLSTSQASDRVDIYNTSTGAWTTATLSQARAFCAATAVGKKIIIAGGVTSANANSDRVDIYNTETGAWTTSTLSEARGFTTQGATVCGKAYFAGGGTASLQFFGFQTETNRVDVYDPATNSWTQETLQNPLINHSVVSVKNKLLVAGGIIFPSTFNKKVEIYSCTGTSGLEALETGTADLNLQPNPAAETLTLSISSDLESSFQVQVFDFNGRLIQVFEMPAQSEYSLNISAWNKGAYVVKAMGEKTMAVKKMIKL